MQNVPPEQSVDIRDFLGLMTDIDIIDQPPGYTEDQVNATCLDGAELTSRFGYRYVLFEA